jgi:acetyltransferase-like isoleucine patch superfamily enzyme
VVIRDGHPHTSFVDGASVPATAPVTVEDDVAIPGHAILKQGTTIGEGAIIATGSVVTRDVPPGTLVAGTPATVRKTNVDWDW